MPLPEAARRYLEVVAPGPPAPSPAQVEAYARELARRLPLVRLAGGALATTRAALEARIALKRARGP